MFLGTLIFGFVALYAVVQQTATRPNDDHEPIEYVDPAAYERPSTITFGAVGLHKIGTKVAAQRDTAMHMLAA